MSGPEGDAGAGGPADAGRRKVVVTVDGDLAGTLPRLREAGLTVDATLTTMSIVTGTVDDAGEKALAALHGVHVEREDALQIQPPPAPQ
ncbi:hypothetical protein C8046_13425 [Serinibacter arcticus]|uniref:Uncharacterized protein n=1 Tax=Serinibacter arcticus TaxID=1655435 RepID=A0A2U1ZX39_9MICO|nr:hypothetical protein [Serinibacter arcticus]PWD51510.1 hypothetical protein C8046_13425 [Serinibacter arcticus]